MTERSDFPVFSVEEAMKQVLAGSNEDGNHMNGNGNAKFTIEKSQFGKEMDDFFVKFLPQDIIDLGLKNMGIQEDNSNAKMIKRPMDTEGMFSNVYHSDAKPKQNRTESMLPPINDHYNKPGKTVQNLMSDTPTSLNQVAPLTHGTKVRNTVQKKRNSVAYETRNFEHGNPALAN